MKNASPTPPFPISLSVDEEPTQPHRIEADQSFEPPHLVQVQGHPLGAVHRLDRVLTTFGRDATADIQLRSPQISRMHASIETAAKGTFVFDVGSENGTFLNGHRLMSHERCSLSHGDMLDLGGVALFRFAGPQPGGPEDKVSRGRGMLGPRDTTTGTLVVGLFHTRYIDEFVLAHNHGLALSLLVVDVIAFSKVNETFGNPGGDTFLREVAARLTATTRRADFVTRWNADQFLILCRCVGKEAEQLAHRLIDAVAGRAFIIKGVAVSAEIAVGIASIPDPRFINAEGLFGAAINALCDAKGVSGGARVRSR